MPTLNFREYLPIRQVNDPSLGKVLADIESHMPAGHIYKDADKVTWAHETSHGLASNLRMKFRPTNSRYSAMRIDGYNVYGGTNINAFYLLENRAIVLDEPNSTIREVAAQVPQSLRGSVYDLYMVKQAGAWNNVPLYIVDELVAYTNGSAAGIDLSKLGKWTGGRRGGTIQYMLEFNIYSLTLAMVLNEKDKGYAHGEFKDFLGWSIDRSLGLYKESKNHPNFADPGADTYLEKFQNSPDAKELLDFSRGYLREPVTKLLDYGASEFL